MIKEEEIEEIEELKLLIEEGLLSPEFRTYCCDRLRSLSKE